MSGLALAISAGLAAAGAGTEAYANHQALTKQDQAAAAGIMAQQRLKQQAQADLQPAIQTAKNNDQNIAANRTALNSQYAAALQRAAPVQNTNGALPGASKTYAADVAKAVGNNQVFGKNYANLTAAGGAPILTGQQTQEQLGDVATKLGGLNTQSQNANQLTQMQVQAITANPWLLGVGALLGGASRGVGSYYGSKARPDPTTGLTYDPGPGYGVARSGPYEPYQG